MSRASYAYLGFALALVVGLWVILSVGSRHAHAQEDLAGQWKIDPAGGMHVEQSGRFFVLTFDNGQKLDLTLKNQDSDNGRINLFLAGAGSKVRISGQRGGDDFDFQVLGPSPAVFHAHRTERTYQPLGEEAVSQQNNAHHG